MEEIYIKGNSNCLVGREAQEFCSKIEEIEEKNGEEAHKMGANLQNYKNELDEILKELKNRKSQLHNRLNNKGISSIDSVIVDSKDPLKHEQLRFLD